MEGGAPAYARFERSADDNPPFNFLHLDFKFLKLARAGGITVAVFIWLLPLISAVLLGTLH